MLIDLIVEALKELFHKHKWVLVYSQSHCDDKTITFYITKYYQCDICGYVKHEVERIDFYDLYRKDTKSMEIFTSYFSKLNKLNLKDYEPVSISRFTPRWYIGSVCKSLAPSAEILLAYKDDRDWVKFKNKYINELNKLNPHDIYRRLVSMSRGKDIVLMCFEKDYTTCHRSICAEWLRKNVGIIVREIGF